MLKVLSELVERASSCPPGAAIEGRTAIPMQREIATAAMRRAMYRCSPGWQSVAGLRLTETSFAERKDVTVTCIKAKSADSALSFSDDPPSLIQVFPYAPARRDIPLLGSPAEARQSALCERA